MTLTINRDALAHAVDRCSAALAKSNNLLEHMLMRSDDHGLYYCSTDLEMVVDGYVKASGKIDTCAHHASLRRVLGAMPAGELKLTVDGSRMTVKAGKRVMKVPCIPSDDYPAIEQQVDDDVGSIETAALREVIARVMFATTDDSTRVVLSSIRLEKADGKLVARAADGHRAVRYRVACDADGAFDLTLPRRLCSAASELGGSEPPKMLTIARTKSKLWAIADDERVGYGMLGNGEHIAGFDKGVIDVDGTGAVLSGPTKDIAEIVRSLLAVGESILFREDKADCRVSCHPRGEAPKDDNAAGHDIIPNDAPFEAFCLNGHYVADALKACPSERVALVYRGGDVMQSVALLRADGSDWICSIVPVRL